MKVIPSKEHIPISKAKTQKEAAGHEEEAWIRVTEVRVPWLLESLGGCVGVYQRSNSLNQTSSSFV